MAKRKGSKRKSRAASQGELPGEYLKRSLVPVPIRNPLAQGEGQKDAQGWRYPEEHWIVKTRRLDGQFTVEVEIRGVVTTMPHKVVAQVERHLASIRKAQRSDAAKERAQALKEVGLTPFLKTAEGGWHE